MGRPYLPFEAAWTAWTCWFAAATAPAIVGRGSCTKIFGWLVFFAI